MTTIITQTAATAPLDSARPATRQADAGLFESALRSYASTAEATTPLASPAIVNPLLLQEIVTGDRLRRDRDARDRGKTLLDALEALRRAMLGSGDEQAELARLSDLLSSIPQADDPQLSALVRAIAVRAAVELSRRGLG